MSININLKKKKTSRDFPGGLVVRTPWSHCQGSGFNPWSGNYNILQPWDQKTKQKHSKLEFSLSKIVSSSASLQIVGNLLYYRYMNPAIVAPDGFDIIDMTAGGQINSDQRRNLGSVAKVLQHAASNKLFEGENEHLSSMNSYLSETYQEFRWKGSLPLEKLARW